MKKQLLIAAVAASMTSVAMADISMTGNAKFEYKNTDKTTAGKTNTSNSEVNVSIRGKNGGTAVVLDLEFNTHGATSTAGHVDVEDMYMTTKIGDVSLKLGNYSSGTSGILGEIDEGGRAHNKITASTTVAGVKVYLGNGGSITQGTSDQALNTNMFAGVSAKVAGYTVQAKHNSPTVNSFGIAGDVAGFGVRLETKQSDDANSDVNFGNITKTVNDISLAYAWIDGDTDGLIGESDSAIFAVENNGQGKSNAQVSAKTSIDGNTITVKAGSIGHSEAGLNDDDYTQVSVSRSLAAGSTLAMTYTDSDDRATGDNTNSTQTFEVDLSVKF